MNNISLSRYAHNNTTATEWIPVWKRALDLVTVCALLPAALPLMALIALTIRCTSRGPVLFRQERVGLRGKRFMCLKFRSMVLSADVRDHQRHFQKLITAGMPMTKLDSSGDTRLIRCGSFLRSTGLDELPQIFNILRGDMSVVGPRPCIPYEYEMYDDRQKQRFDAVPGLTGLWQVNGKNKTTFEQMVQMDLFYAHHKSFWLDLRIIVQTLPAVLQQTIEWVQKRLPRTASHANQVPEKPIADSL